MNYSERKSVCRTAPTAEELFRLVPSLGAHVAKGGRCFLGGFFVEVDVEKIAFGGLMQRKGLSSEVDVEEIYFLAMPTQNSSAINVSRVVLLTPPQGRLHVPDALRHERPSWHQWALVPFL